MISRTAAILTATLTLGICLLILVLVTVVLSIRYVRHQRSLREKVCGNLNSQIQEKQKQLELFATRLDVHGSEDTGTSVNEIITSYERKYRSPGSQSPIQKYVEKWVSRVQLQPPTPDDIARIEGILYKPLRPSAIPRSIDRNISIFSNPQQYTTAEIAKYLHAHNRSWMVVHIMTAILLKNTSINGHPGWTLLPLGAEDIDGLFNLADVMRKGLFLGSRLAMHIHRFGFYKCNRHPTGQKLRREAYQELFETLFQPYFTSSSPDDVAARRVDLDKVFDVSVAHGMDCLDFFGEIDYKWDERKDGVWEMAPAMTSSDGAGGFIIEVAKSDWMEAW